MYLCMVVPVLLQASTGRDLGSLNASEGGLGDASRAGTQGRNGATDAASSGGDSARAQAVVAAPSASDVAAGEARDTGAALQQFAAMLSSKKRHYFMVSNGGFPIYTRHGRPHDTASIAALLYSIVSLSLDALGAPPALGVNGRAWGLRGCLCWPELSQCMCSAV